MNTAYLSLGTNLGDKLQNLNDAVQKTAVLGKIKVISSVYQAPAWGFSGDDFFNIAIALKTPMDAHKLIKELLDIETSLGRIRNEQTNTYKSRLLDIDIIFFNDDIINTKALTIPHPKMQDRKFVLMPMLEIAPKLKHPVLNKHLGELLQQTEDSSKITITNHTLKA